MSSRFHNKWHRHNHHTNTTPDPRYPDSAHDPIASPEAPFQGDFFLQGSLSASNDITGTHTWPIESLSSEAINPVLAAGEFLIIQLNDGTTRLIRMWNNT